MGRMTIASSALGSNDVPVRTTGLDDSPGAQDAALRLVDDGRADEAAAGAVIRQRKGAALDLVVGFSCLARAPGR